MEEVQELSLGLLAQSVDASLADLLAALFQILREDASYDRWAIINRGCSETDLNALEKSIGFRLPLLHRVYLALSNGGTIPFVTSISLMYAAVPRESEWRITGQFLSQPERSSIPFITARQIQPIHPQYIGRTSGELSAEGESKIADSRFIPFASGFGGQTWGYVADEGERIECIVPDIGQYTEASAFHEFLAQQSMSEQCSKTQFKEVVRSHLS